MIFKDIHGNIVDINPATVKDACMVADEWGVEDLSKTAIIFTDDSEIILDSPFTETVKALLWPK